jgi:hypothetical protein
MNINRFHKILLSPLVLSCIYLLCISFNSQFENYIDSSIIPILCSGVVLIAVFYLFILGLINRNIRSFVLVGCFICAVTPLSVMYPWVAAPDNMGMGFGGYAFFLDWLTKYPNFLRINIEVLLGIICVILSSMVPAVFCYLYTSGKPYQKGLFILAFIEISTFIPVFFKLDWLMILLGTCGIFRLGGTHSNNLVVLAGPFLKLLSFIFMMIVILLKIVKKHGLIAKRNER